MMQSQTTNIDPLSVPPEAYLAWVRTTMEAQDDLIEKLMAPLMGMDIDVAVSDQWLEDLSEVAHAFVEPDAEQAQVAMNMTFRA